MKPSLQLFNWGSLRTRITVGVLLVGLAVLWATVFALSHTLRRDMEATISAQQFSTISLIANEIDRSVRERQSLIESIAARLSTGKLRGASGDEIQAYLEQREIPESVFNWGIIVIDAKGTAIASTPDHLKRRGVDFSKYPGIADIMGGQHSYITDPLFSEHSQQPVVAMLVAVQDPEGKASGAVIGVTNLARSNFLDEIGNAKYGNTGDFVVTAPRSRTYVASSDRRRVMKAGPPPGRNAVYDRYIDGYEGSGVALSSRGVVELSSSKRIASTGWLMQSVLPAEEAFASIRAMQRHLLVISLALTLLASLTSWWWLRRQLQPLTEASELLGAMRQGKIPRQALPVRKLDEIGQLTTAFNGLQEVIVAEEAKAAEYSASKRLRRIVSSVPGVVFQYRLYPDGSGSFPFTSDAISEIYGVTPEEMAVSAAPIRKMLFPDDAERFLASLNESAKALAPWRIEYRINHPSGQLKWLLVDAVPEAGSDHTITWYGFIADITETKAMEAELRQAIVEHKRKDAEIERYRDHLEQLVSERTADLELARAHAERLARVKSEFLANMSHEIRTPLNGVLGMAHIGLRATSAGDKAHDAFTKIVHSGQLLLGVINDILDFSKMEAGMLKIESSDMDLRSALRESVEMMQERATAKGLGLILELADNLPATCRSDALRIRQILLNLLSNAVKFTTTGGVTLEAGCDGQWLVFRVSDTGIGITPELHGKIFSPFEQGDNSTTRRFGGTGLGLAITERIVRLMAGSITVDSAPASGSCFEVRLPYRPAADTRPGLSAPPKQSGSEIDQPLAGLNILVAEDVAVNQEIMTEILEDVGASVVIAHNGKEAVDRVRDSEPGAFDVVLMDIQMPLMNGHDATREILRLRPELPIIGQTAHALAEEQAACRRSGMVDHVSKPIDPERLYAIILKHTQPHPPTPSPAP